MLLLLLPPPPPPIMLTLSFMLYRFILACGIHSMPYGSALIPEDEDADCPMCTSSSSSNE